MQRFAARPPSRWGLILAAALVGLPVLLVVALAAGLGFASVGVDYRVDAAGLHVRGGFWLLRDDRNFARADIAGAREVVLEGTPVRTHGTATGRYCGGSWRADGLGAFWGAWDCSRDVVAVDVSGETIVVAPSDRAAFLAALADPAGAYSGGVALGSAAPPGLVSGLALPGVLFVLVGLLFVRMLRPMVYVVEGGVLTAPAFFRAVRVDLRGARAAFGPGNATFRLAGGALPGTVYIGLFRGNGENFHAAVTTMKSGWHIRGARHVFVTPADDAGFAAALRVAGAEVQNPSPTST